MKQELLKDVAGVLGMTPYLFNRPAVASSATVTVKNSSGAIVVAAGTAATVNGTTGEITYSISAGLLNVLGENWKIDWVYVISGATYYQSQLFDVVLNKLSITVTDQDLLNEQRDILERNFSFSGAVDSSGATTLVDADLKSFADDFFNNGSVMVVNPATNAEQIRNVTDFVQSTGTLTIGTAWGTNPDSTYKYIVRKGFSEKIQAAFEEVMFEIRARGFRPALILESSELHIPLVKKALALICRDYMVTPEDKWMVLANDYDRQFKDLMSTLRIQYDVDESGLISGVEKSADAGNVRLRR